VTDIGTVLGGRYRLVELLGQGGMATIYRARDGQLERDVAVKVLRPEYGQDPDFFARFRQEAQSAASLNHPGVVHVYDYGTDEVGPFIVMELVDGEDLASIVRRIGALPPRQAARIVAQAARAIAAAHDRGFVHRDIKPGNILVGRDGRVKVSDFGIARALAEAQLTLPGTTLGSVHYFSPEQARGELATQASDIYSLGIVLFELLTGRRPWEGDSAAAIATARLSGEVPAPSASRPGTPAVLDAIARKAMALDPAQRFRSAADLAAALEQYVADSTPVAQGADDAGGTGAGGRAADLPSAAELAAAAAARSSDPSPTVASGIARPNPGVPYADDAYVEAGGPPRRSSGGRRPVATSPDDGGGGGSGPWLWVSAGLAVAVLALAGFLAFKFLSGGTPTPSGDVVSVPSFLGKSYAEAQTLASSASLVVAIEGSVTDGTVVGQDPSEGVKVEKGSTVKLTLAAPDQTTIVPDLRGKLVADALNLIAQSNLTIGDRTDAYDPLIPEGAVVSQDPGVGLVVAKGTKVDYVVSMGPEPSASPSPSPSPSPTAAPTPTPTPGARNVGEYRCVALAVARLGVESDGFTVGTISGSGYGEDWIVIAQNPLPGTSQPWLTAIDLTVVDPTAAPTPCP
jgi:predicted Ser/Thr protein kinase